MYRVVSVQSNSVQVRATCDKCGRSKQVRARHEEDALNVLYAEGWQDSGGLVYCSKCKSKR